MDRVSVAASEYVDPGEVNRGTDKRSDDLGRELNTKTLDDLFRESNSSSKTVEGEVTVADLLEVSDPEPDDVDSAEPLELDDADEQGYDDSDESTGQEVQSEDDRAAKGDDAGQRMESLTGEGEAYEAKLYRERAEKAERELEQMRQQQAAAQAVVPQPRQQQQDEDDWLDQYLDGPSEPDRELAARVARLEQERQQEQRQAQIDAFNRQLDTEAGRVGVPREMLVGIIFEDPKLTAQQAANLAQERLGKSYKRVEAERRVEDKKKRKAGLAPAVRSSGSRAAKPAGRQAPKRAKKGRPSIARATNRLKGDLNGKLRKLFG